MQDRFFHFSIGDIKSTMQNFVEKLKEQLLEGKTVNIAGLGVFLLAAKSKGEEKAEDVTAKSVDSVRIFFQANKELKITKTATRAGEKVGSGQFGRLSERSIKRSYGRRLGQVVREITRAMEGWMRIHSDKES